MKFFARQGLADSRHVNKRWAPVECLENRLLLSVVNEFPLSSPTSWMNSLAAGPNNTVQYTTFLGEPGSFNVYTHAETTANGGVPGLSGVVAGPDGNMWYTDAGDNAVISIDTNGDMVGFYYLGDGAQPTAITVGTDGAIWATGSVPDYTRYAEDGSFLPSADAAFFRITTDGEVTSFNTNIWSSYGEGITAGQDGSMWITASLSSVSYTDVQGNPAEAIGQSMIARLDPANYNTITTYDVGAGMDRLAGITTGADGSIYYVQAISQEAQAPASQELIGKITGYMDSSIDLTKFVINPDTSVAINGLLRVVGTADGKIWFTQYNTQSIGSLDPTTGTLANYDVPTGKPVEITVGPDGNIWFTEPDNGILGQVDLSQLQTTVEISANGTSIDSLAELPFSGPVASFTSNLAGATPSSFTASIDWGNGTITTGTISLAEDGVTYLVNGSNTYDTPGTYAVTVTVSSASVTTPAVANSTATVETSLIGVGNNSSHAERSAYTYTVATFVGPVPAADYTATITWGDSTTSAGTIVTTSAGYEVRGTHTFASQGSYTTSVSIADAHQSLVVSGNITISDTPLVVTGQTVTAILPKWAIGFVATFTDDANLGATKFTASINWGDGSTSGGLIVSNPLKAGSFLVLGVHQYKKRGTYTTVTTITNLLEGSIVTGTGKAVV